MFDFYHRNSPQKMLNLKLIPSVGCVQPCSARPSPSFLKLIEVSFGDRKGGVRLEIVYKVLFI